MARVVLAMSGGVDSSVAAQLLLQAGHELVGVFMRHGEESSQVCREGEAPAEPTNAGRREGEAPAEPTGVTDARLGPSRSLPLLQVRAGHKQGCCTASDAADARRVAAKLQIPFYALDLQQDFRRIVDYFVDDYLSGRTPNPCVRCNQWIKFGRLFDYADGIDAQFVATGHYARMESGPQLHRGLDDTKDQSYALFGIRHDRLSRMLLPVGDYQKSEIRQIARSLNLGVAGKKDSQEICFVTQGHHSDFVRAREPKRSADTAGPIVTAGGTVVGQHQGYEAYTVGQRRGLGVAMGTPHFVIRIEPESRRVVIGTQAELLTSELTAAEANWLIDPAELPERVAVQIRYNSPPKAARLSIDPASPARFSVRFEQPQSAVAPGQAAVVYDDTRVLGGGWIR